MPHDARPSTGESEATVASPAPAFAPFDVLEVPIRPGVTLVEASAGTGKTHSLTRLVLRLLLEGAVEALPQVLVVTFTEKAAQELVTRVRGVLREARQLWSDTPPERTGDNADLFELRARFPEHGRIVLERAARSLDDLAVFTIHGFCHRILGENALEAGASFTGHFIEDETRLLQRAAHDWARGRLVRNRESAELVANATPDQADPAAWIRPVVAPYRRFPDTRVEHGTADAARLLADFTRRVHDRFEHEKRHRDLSGYDDLLRTVRDVLAREGADGPLARRIRERFRAVLVDEYQDTDPVQGEIFRRAFGGCPVFLVGDPKQSIYAFRGADVHAYLQTSRTAAARFTLQHNYRSVAPLVRAVQGLFRFRGDQPFGAVPLELPPVESARTDAPVVPLDRAPLEWIWLGEALVTSRGAISQEVALDHAIEAIAAEVVRLRDARLPGGDIAVLVRTNDHAREVHDALRRAGVAAVIGSDADVLASAEAREVTLLAAAIAEPRHGNAVRAALTTQLWGADAAEVARLGSPAGEADWTRITDRFLVAQQAWLRHGPDRAMWALLAEREVTTRLLARADGERAFTNLRHLLEFVRDAHADEPIAPGAFGAWIATEQQVPNVPERREQRLERDGAAVQILTVHKAKGLQWPVVFCLDLWKPPRKPKPLLGVDVALARETSADGAGTRRVLDLGSPAGAERREQAQLEERDEALRLAYVALTRAESRCYVVGGLVSGIEQSALGWLVGDPTGGKVTLERLKQLVESRPGEMAVRDVSECGVPVRLTRSEEQATFEEVRRLARRAGQLDPWRLSSFTALTGRAHGAAPVVTEMDDAAVGRDVDDTSDDAGEGALGDAMAVTSMTVATPAVAMDRAMDAVMPGPAGDGDTTPVLSRFRGLPVGAAIGSALHTLLEGLDFGAPEALADAAILAALHAEGIVAPRDGAWAPADIRAQLGAVLYAPMPGAGFALASVPVDATLREWRFTLPVAQFVPARIADALEAYGSAHARAYAPVLRTLPAEAFAGYLTGSVDLAFEHAGRWHLVDWKSNRLRDGAGEAYDPRRLAAAMHEAHYTLQYHLYLLALHRHLRARQPGYDPARHWGQVAYVFLRGVTGAGDAGWFTDTPTPALLEALDVALGGRR